MKLHWLFTGVWFLCRVLLIAWTSLAIYYSNLPWPELRLGLAAGFAAFAVWVFWRSRRRPMYVVLATLILGVWDRREWDALRGVWPGAASVTPPV